MKKRILLGNDNPVIKEMLVRVLECDQFEVVLARTGRKAVAKSLVLASIADLMTESEMERQSRLPMEGC
jgi:DNA-binding response OmpR family regulator